LIVENLGWPKTRLEEGLVSGEPFARTSTSTVSDRNPKVQCFAGHLWVIP